MTPCMQNAGFRSLNTNVKLLRFLFTGCVVFLYCMHLWTYLWGREGGILSWLFKLNFSCAAQLLLKLSMYHNESYILLFTQ